MTTSVPSGKRQMMSDASSSNKRTKKDVPSIKASSSVKFLKKPKRKRSHNCQLQYDMDKISQQFPFSPQMKNFSGSSHRTIPGHGQRTAGPSSASVHEKYVDKVDVASLLMNLRSK